MFDSLINNVDKFGLEILTIQFGFLIIICTLFLWLWYSNRRKYHNLKHAIPANVVKSYLDSIIQNSTSLKSSLFRGGGLEVNGIPSVMPLGHLMGGDNMAMSGAPSTALMEELNQKKAHISVLESQMATLQNAQREFESKNSQHLNTIATLEAKIKELEALLAQSRNGAGGDEGLKNELSMLSKERDDLKDRLKEFEIIADDLANLKRLQQENEQLKRSLAAQGGSLPTPQAADVSDILADLGQPVAPNLEENRALEDMLSAPEEIEARAPVEEPSPAQEPEAEIVATSENTEETKSKSEKTPEDLLSEFEKMLG